jgi:hypothetical protein
VAKKLSLSSRLAPRLDGLIARFGPDIALPDLLIELASCTRRADFSRPRGARFTDLGPAAPMPHDPPSRRRAAFPSPYLV